SSDRLATSCVDFLIRPDALVPYEERVTKVDAQIDGVDKVARAKALGEEIDDAASELEMLIEIVSNLKIDDTTQRTTIIENISAIFARLNRIRAGLQNKMQSLASREGAAEFASQIKLLNQAVVNYLDICDAPEKCEEYLTKLMIQVEELEARFAEFDEMIDELGQKREEIYNAFEARRLQLVEAKNRRATTLMKSADRILKGITTRVQSLDSVDTIHGYFASDLMVDKVRDIIHQLSDLGDSVKVGDIQSRLKTIREDAVRQLKDRQDLYVDGQNIIQFGRHKFAVNTQSLDLTTVLRDGQMQFHLIGTNFFEPITNPDLLATRDVWDQEILSENPSVYRAEYLAYILLRSNEPEGNSLFLPTAFPKTKNVAERNPASYYSDIVQQFMAPRYAEGYIKGVHDHDGAILLQALVEMTSTIGLLRYGSRPRTLAWLFWQTWDESVQKQIFAARLAGFGKITSLFPETTTQADCIAELQQLVGTWLASFECPLANNGSSGHSPCFKPLGDEAGEYLFHALAGGETFVTSGDADRLCQRFREHLAKKAYESEFANSLEKLAGSLTSQFRLACDWITAFLDETDADAHTRSLCDEVAQLLIEGDYDTSRIISASTVRDLEGLVGSHPRITDGRMRLSYNEFTTRLSEYQQTVVPAFQKYQALKYQLTDTRRAELKLDEFRPRVLTSFVRNRLIDRVYLPLIGDNQAKQIGTAGAETRTDRMGLLLLISPPGYGKTTLMEYVANRLGIIFMKVNGPAIGHRVTSLDPAEAPNAAAREEIEKLNLALEMGDNVMIYVDDIQHVSPEFLQKFISLCDATRKIEGVWNGRTRTYDLRGKKVSVVMAGNPYTESGTRFKIPDMLANRADTYNLGEIIGDNKIAFEMSYLENAMTSNPTLARVANRNPEDIYSLIQMAETDSKEPVDLAGNYSVDELGEMVKVLKKLIRVRDVVLAVNREYIRSAGQADEYRTEPPFKLQGSYRNMNRIAEHVSPVMNDSELNTLIFSQYEQDAQTLTTGAEANLLKFRELIGQLTGADAKRWEEIKRTFRQNQKLRGMDASDKVGQVIAQISTVADGLDAIRDAVVSGIEERAAADDENAIQRDTAARLAAERLEGMGHQMDAFRTSLDAIQQTLASGLAKLEYVPTNTPASPTPPYQIEVINRVPRVFLSIIREQFKLMQSWMQPLIKTTQENRQGMEELQKQLDAAMENYGKLVDQLEETE
ncbi:MAG: AAA family ATPase, partial [Pirellulales bacterium]|nr:AAA family ATPase [Pirellulales bacterium]